VSSGLSDHEVRYLDLVAFGYDRRRQRARDRATALASLRAFAIERSRAERRAEPGLVASMGEPGALVAPWAGVIGAEGRLTGDGRLIEYGALSWATFPLPLRWAPVDWGGHDGAVLVGRIDSIERRPNGAIFARGGLDHGREMGREAEPLMRLVMLGGVSVDLDGTTMRTVKATATSPAALVTSDARVRAATLVAIPAFTEARIALVDAGPQLATYVGQHPAEEDCGCDDFGPGVSGGLPGIDEFPTLDDMPTIEDMQTLRASLTRYARPNRKDRNNR